MVHPNDGILFNAKTKCTIRPSKDMEEGDSQDGGVSRLAEISQNQRHECKS